MTDRVLRRLAAILSADVVGYTRLTQADEEGTLARVRAQRSELIEPKISAFGGRVFKLMGDGLLAEFPSVVDAVQCADDLQREIAERNTVVPEGERIVLRVGVNLGDVIVDGDDVQGDGVNVATRMQEIAEPGGVTVSGIVYDSVRDKLPVELSDLGPQRMKNIDEPVRAYRLARAGGTGVSAAARPPAPDVDWEAVPAPADGPGMVMSILSSNRRSGVWSVPRRMNVLAVMGSLELDLRDARFEPGVTRIDVLNVMGSVEIMAPEGVVVESDGIGVLGNFEGTTRGAENPDANAPVLRIRGVAVMGHTATN